MLDIYMPMCMREKKGENFTVTGPLCGTIFGSLACQDSFGG